MFHRKQTTLDLGEGLIQTKIKYESQECEQDSQEGKSQRILLLRYVIETPELLNCGDGMFEKLVMTHNGVKWTIELIRNKE
jgi:hypothetical protein